MEYNSYIKVHFDTTGYFNNFTCENPSIIGRIANLMQFALEWKVGMLSAGKHILPLPKLIVVVAEDAFFNALGLDNEISCVSRTFSRLLNYVMTEFERAEATFKENLPAKCIKQDYPYFLWIQSPMHKNFLNCSHRYKFNKSLEEVSKLHQNIFTLALKKVWCEQDDNLYLDSQHFSAAGYRAYWEAVDKTAIFRLCSTKKV